MTPDHSPSNNGDRPVAQPTQRGEAPLYLARYRDRRQEPPVSERPAGDDPIPTYVRAYQRRQVTPAGSRSTNGDDTPLWQRSSLEIQQALTEDNRNKEISPPADAVRTLVNDVYLIRHGETQGYTTDSGLTPQGAMQAYTYGHTLAKRSKSGETIVFRHADTNRARETAEQIHRGLLTGIETFEKELTIVDPAPMDEFRNFQFAAPDGLKDVTAAFRQYYAQVEEIERTVSGDRPLWLVEMDRFWRTQQGGGDPIQHWLTIPMLHFEPPSMAVRRFWAGINRLSAEFPGARLAIATHSGCIRAFAVAALGYDPGEPYNTEHVRVKLYDHDAGRGDASVAYRNRVQDVKVPTVAGLPAWSVVEDWDGSGIR